MTPRLWLPSAGVECLKWAALLAMVVDHVNAAFFGREVAWAIPVGRLAFPVFAFVLAYNLARPGADAVKLLRRLLVFGLLAAPFHAALFASIDHWWPLNVMFTFAVAVAVIVCFERSKRQWQWAVTGVLTLLTGGAVVEFFWPGVLLVTSMYGMLRYGVAPHRVSVFALALLGLCLANGNPWALAAIPLVAGAQVVRVTVPRARWLFWAFYPAHLCLLMALVVAGVGAAHG